MRELECVIEMAQSNGNYGTIVMGGDFNLPNIKWEDNFSLMGLSLNSQEELFVDFLFRFCMFNYVNIETLKGGKTLDLILTNDTSLIQNVRSNINVKFSDHYFVLCDINISYEIKT